MRLLLKLALALSPLIPFFVNANALSATLGDRSLNLTYDKPVRLHQVLADTNQLLIKQNSPAPFWLGAQLFEPSQNESIDILKAQVLEKLRYLAKYYPDSTFKADLLTSLIKKNEFSYRHFIPLDNDLVRLKPELNPMLSGRLTLLTPSRENKVFLVGTTLPLRSEPLKPIQMPANYFAPFALPKNSDTAQIFVIQPDGSITPFRSEYWDRQQIYLAPGSILFAGFKNLPREHASLNHKIAQLLSHMKYPKKGSYQ